MDRLEQLPARIDSLGSQILQFRGEVRVEFSAVRQEMRDLGETLRAEMRVMQQDLVARIDAGDEETRRQMGVMQQDLVARIDETGLQMRVLHEDVISRIALLNEGLNGPSRRSRARGPTKPSSRKPKS